MTAQMSVINVRDPETMLWGDEAYEFDQERRDNLALIWGRENVRVISVEEMERSRVRKRQDDEFNEDPRPAKKKRPKKALPTIEELRALRVAYYDKKCAKRRKRGCTSPQPECSPHTPSKV